MPKRFRHRKTNAQQVERPKQAEGTCCKYSEHVVVVVVVVVVSHIISFFLVSSACGHKIRGSEGARKEEKQVMRKYQDKSHAIGVYVVSV